MKPSRGLSRPEALWSLTESANEPWFNLVQRYVFAPYFAGTLASSQAQGASAWGFALGAAGLVIAVLAPSLGAIADGAGRRRPWLGASALLLILAGAGLWFAEPGASILWVALLVFLGTVAAELLSQFCNAFLPGVTNPKRYGLLSGLAFGASQLVGILVLLLVLGLASADIPFLANLQGGVNRLAGPIAAAAVLLFLVPFLLIARDPPANPDATLGKSMKQLKATLREAWADPAMRWFLIGRMFAADGLAVIFAFGGVLAAASFGWKADSLAIFGITITVFGVIGGLSGAFLDSRIGSKRLLLMGLVITTLATGSVLATDGQRLFGMPTGVELGVPMTSPQELGFLGAGAFIALGAAFAICAMRTLMAKLAPPERIASYFGLFAFVGKATAFVGPFLVAVLASIDGSVRPGIAIAVSFLIVGIIAFSRVPQRRAG